MSASFNPREISALQTLARLYPTVDCALAEASALKAGLSLPKGVVHIVSDVHGEYKKLRHIINNASGSLRPLVEFLFENRLSADELRLLMAVLYYPRETIEYQRTNLVSSEQLREWARRILRFQFEVVLALARGYRQNHVVSLFPKNRLELFQELALESSKGRGPGYVNLMIDSLTI